jgi:hypothetical protein
MSATPLIASAGVMIASSPHSSASARAIACSA